MVKQTLKASGSDRDIYIYTNPPTYIHIHIYTRVLTYLKLLPRHTLSWKVTAVAFNSSHPSGPITMIEEASVRCRAWVGLGLRSMGV